MKKVRKRRKSNKNETKRQLLKFGGAVVLIVVAVGLLFSTCEKTGKQDEIQQIRGVWVSYVDYKTLGLNNKTEEEFRRNAETFYKKAEEMSMNTVFFHVRAFMDAAYDSDYFPMSRHLWSRSEQIDYDPLEIMIELAHAYGMELHAWLNPYRKETLEEPILDPAETASTENILLCVNELLDNYDVDGIHFDDYFYKEDSDVSTSEKKKYVNKMVKTVYSCIKNYDPGIEFGISPAGNVSYCESIGADVKTWMSEDGYVDYVIPQIYWTDEHSATWRDKMFSDTLDEWCSMRKNDISLYIGLALYRTGLESEDDPGWEWSDRNIAEQICAIQEKNCDGFVLFSSGDFFREGAQTELSNYLQQIQ